MKVMIVDDQPTMRALIREVLNLSESEVTECSGGAEAVASYDQVLPDWVSMDCRMEPMDGISATAAICRRHPAARIVMVSNWDEPAFREAACAAGAVAYVLKNNLHELSDIIRPSRPAR